MTIDALPLTPAMEPAPPVACPSCHTARQQGTQQVAAAGGDWRCGRCGEQWTASRLATVAEHDARDRERENAATERGSRDREMMS
jgi:predicted Zn finger-like uncharacterized protein